MGGYMSLHVSGFVFFCLGFSALGIGFRVLRF